MNRVEQFLDFFDYLITHCKEPVEVPADVLEFVNDIRENGDIKKVTFTDTGLEIIKVLQAREPGEMVSAKDIADDMDVSPRKVSGAARKLVADGFLEKSGKSPVMYALTNMGLNLDVDNCNKEND